MDTILHALTVPPEGGDARLANMTASTARPRPIPAMAVWCNQGLQKQARW